MENAPAPANVLDLTSKQTLFELAITDNELLGPAGAKLIADLKERAGEAEYTHLYFRDPIRPGIIWFTAVAAEEGEISVPTRGRLDECREVCEMVFPQFLESLVGCDEEAVTQRIPPLALGVTALELASALEYIVFVHPSITRAWAALIFTYAEMMGLRDGAESAREACMGTCQYAQVVPFLLGESSVET